MAKLILVPRLTSAVAVVLLSAGCSSISFENYQPRAVTTDELTRAKDSFNAGSVSGQTTVVSDELVKSSLECRTHVAKTPGGEPLAVYIENALRAELATANKADTNPNRRIDITVVRFESDASKVRNGEWTLDFIYKIGRVARDIQTTTSFAFSSDAVQDCQNEANAFNEALRENFKEFFATLR